ncbi:signal peptidase I [Sphingomonas sp. HDW15A]|uniref:signal peptidase I n=1 Tax=Sphingomonas sp. HDW15A TaxID=2714942 RepID=UPI001F0F5981|nr:signal peptidase I [Sphingomonas sp. HDW15A]
MSKETKGSALWREIKGIFWVVLAVLAFHSFIAKPFYIPSESMMPVLLKGDRLVVTKYPYGWSYVSLTIPNPAAIFRSLVLRGPPEPWGITLPPMKGRLFGSVPKRGDIVIVTPPGSNEDYIKRVIGLPGDTIELRGGRLILNGAPVRSQVRPPTLVPVDANAPCGPAQFAGQYVEAGDGRAFCRLPIVRETLPGGVSYDTIDLGPSGGDDFGPLTIPQGHLFLMGDNRDRSADSRFELGPPANGLGGPVPIENIGGRAEFITFSLDGTTSLNPATWVSSFRSGRAGTSLRGDTVEAGE